LLNTFTAIFSIPVLLKNVVPKAILMAAFV